MVKDCPRCKGAGKIAADKPCPWCDGAGYSITHTEQTPLYAKHTFHRTTGFEGQGARVSGSGVWHDNYDDENKEIKRRRRQCKIWHKPSEGAGEVKVYRASTGELLRVEN